MGNSKDHLGEVYGDSIVIRRTRSLKQRVWWVLRCGCGNEFEVTSALLVEGKTLSCGCIRGSRSLLPEVGQMACEVPSVNYPDGRTGTYAGYQAHVKISETPCDECDSARKEYNANKWANLPKEKRAEVRKKNAIAARKYSEKHPSRRRDVVDKRRSERIEIIREAKDKPCEDCGIQYPYYVMQFDHVRGEKKFNVGGGWNNSVEAIVGEIDKCEVVCGNCHAERTYQRMANRDVPIEELEKIIT